MAWAIAEVSDYLIDEIRAGKYALGDSLPTLDELNRDFFGEGAGPRPGRAAYAQLIAAGMVEARQGRHGGHFLISDKPETATKVMVAATNAVANLRAAVDALASIRWYVAELQDIKTGAYFGESFHPNRLAAEAYAMDILTRLGEEPQHVKSAARAAGRTCADTRGAGYGIRIYAVTLDGDTRVDISGRRE